MSLTGSSSYQNETRLFYWEISHLLICLLCDMNYTSGPILQILPTAQLIYWMAMCLSNVKGYINKMYFYFIIEWFDWETDSAFPCSPCQGRALQSGLPHTSITWWRGSTPSSGTRSSGMDLKRSHMNAMCCYCCKTHCSKCIVNDEVEIL